MRRPILSALACGVLLTPLASAQDPPATSAIPLMPGVTFEQHTDLTPHGPVAYSVITAPAPTGGLTTIAPVLGGGTITGPRETLVQLQESVTAIETVAGVNGDFFSGTHAAPTGIVIAGGALEKVPTPARSSIGFDASGTMHVGRISFTGTWQGSGQRRALTAVNQQPKVNQTVLFTPAWGASTPAVANAAAVVLEPFPVAGVNTDLNATVSAIPDGSTAIPADGAVLVATGTAAAKLQAEAPQGGQVTVRLTLPPSWGSVVSALGGGPLLVKGGKPVFTTGENFASADLTSRQPRTAVGQLADGHVILVTVDGGRPGHSVGMTTYELARTMAKLGAVTAAGLEFGKDVTAAFDTRVLNRPQGSPQKIKEALLVEYQGVYTPAPTPQLVTRAGAAGVSLAYRLVRPSTVTASVVGPDGTSHQIDAGSRQPGTYRFTWSTLDAEGTWHWNVQASDDQSRSSTADVTFQYDLTLSGLAVTRSGGGAKVGFTLSRPASSILRISAPNGTLVDVLPAVSLAAGPGSLAWDGSTPTGTKAPNGTYVATVIETSSIGATSTSASFTLRR
ncbi:MAG TPA: phosphodiester glycosidase family protein [Gaiellaceae bacterium]